MASLTDRIKKKRLNYTGGVASKQPMSGQLPDGSFGSGLMRGQMPSPVAGTTSRGSGEVASDSGYIRPSDTAILKYNEKHNPTPGPSVPGAGAIATRDGILPYDEMIASRRAAGDARRQEQAGKLSAYRQARGLAKGVEGNIIGRNLGGATSLAYNQLQGGTGQDQVTQNLQSARTGRLAEEAAKAQQARESQMDMLAMNGNPGALALRREQIAGQQEMGVQGLRNEGMLGATKLQGKNQLGVVKAEGANALGIEGVRGQTARDVATEQGKTTLGAAAIGADTQRYTADTNRDVGLAGIKSNEDIATGNQGVQKLGIDAQREVGLGKIAADEKIAAGNQEVNRFGITTGADTAQAGFQTQRDISLGDNLTKAGIAQYQGQLSERLAKMNNESEHLKFQTEQARLSGDSEKEFALRERMLKLDQDKQDTNKMLAESTVAKETADTNYVKQNTTPEAQLTQKREAAINAGVDPWSANREAYGSNVPADKWQPPSEQSVGQVMEGMSTVVSNIAATDNIQDMSGDEIRKRFMDAGYSEQDLAWFANENKGSPIGNALYNIVFGLGVGGLVGGLFTGKAPGPTAWANRQMTGPSPEEKVMGELGKRSRMMPQP